MKNIVVGLDGSIRAHAVLTSAVEMARALGGKLVLVRSFGLPPDISQDVVWKTTDEPVIDVLRGRFRKYLDGLAAEIPKELFARTTVEIGSPWQVICDVAKQESAELLVIGSHGYSGFDHLLGTTAAKVVNHAPCSVLVVRDPARTEKKA